MTPMADFSRNQPRYDETSEANVGGEAHNTQVKFLNILKGLNQKTSTVNLENIM